MAHQSRRYGAPIKDRMNMFSGQRVIRRTVKKSIRIRAPTAEGNFLLNIFNVFHLTFS